MGRESRRSFRTRRRAKCMRALVIAPKDVFVQTRKQPGAFETWRSPMIRYNKARCTDTDTHSVLQYSNIMFPLVHSKNTQMKLNFSIDGPGRITRDPLRVMYRLLV